MTPKLICFLPVSAVRQGNGKQCWWEKALSPTDWLNQRILVFFFFDPIQLKLAATTTPMTKARARASRSPSPIKGNL